MIFLEVFVEVLEFATEHSSHEVPLKRVNIRINEMFHHLLYFSISYQSY